MRYYLAPPSSAATAAAPGPWAGGGARAVPSLNLAALQSLPGSGQSSGALSPAPSVSSYSVPPTPRLSTSGSMNGRPGGDSGCVVSFLFCCVFSAGLPVPRQLVCVCAEQAGAPAASCADAGSHAHAPAPLRTRLQAGDGVCGAPRPGLGPPEARGDGGARGAGAVQEAVQEPQPRAHAVGACRGARLFTPWMGWRGVARRVPLRECCQDSGPAGLRGRVCHQLAP
jgi:hypothetical protein